MASVAPGREQTLSGVALLNFEPQKMTANKRVHEEIARLRQLSTCGSVSQSDRQTSRVSVQNCKRPVESNCGNRVNPLHVIGSNFVLNTFELFARRCVYILFYFYFKRRIRRHYVTGKPINYHYLHCNEYLIRVVFFKIAGYPVL